ncbi:MAG TPA: hypothetical protein VFZ32_12200 [Micromonosporaceae bacterium]
MRLPWCWLLRADSGAPVRRWRGSSRHRIDLAASAIEDDHSSPEWLDFYNAGRLHSFAGYAALTAGDQAEAADYLTRALAGTTGTGAKQRSVVLADLATAHRADGDRAADYLNQAIETLHTNWYSTGLDRVREVRHVLGDSGHGTQLDERISALAASRTALPVG